MYISDGSDSLLRSLGDRGLGIERQLERVVWE